MSPWSRLRSRDASLLLLVLVWAATLHGVAASMIGFDPVFTSSATPCAVPECNAVCASPGTVTFQLKLVRSGSLSATDTVYVSTQPPADASLLAATADVDYTSLSSVAVTFAPTETIKTVTVTVISDGVYEEDEYFEAVINSPSAGVTLTASTQVAFITIQDGGDAGIFSFSAASYSFLESAGLVQVRVVRAGGASGTVTVTYRLSNPAQATAVNTKNFLLTDAIYQLNFAENQREAFIPIHIINDAVYEPQEYFYLELSALSPMKKGDPKTGIAKYGLIRSAVVIIADDGDAGQFNFASPSIFCREDNGSAVVSIVRSLGSSSSYTPVTLFVTTVGSSGGSNATEGGSLAFDYIATSDQLKWADGETRKTFAVKVFNNKKYEPLTRAFKIRMTAVEGGAAIGPQSDIWVYIVDDRDGGTLSFKNAQYKVLENAGSVTLEIVRAGLTDTSGVNTYTSGAVTVDIATYAGTIVPGKSKYDLDYDYGVVAARKCTHVSPCTAEADIAYTALASTTLTFADGEASKTVSIPIIDDTLYEAPDQVFKVILQNVTGGAHIGIDYEHPAGWLGYRADFLVLDKRLNELPDNVGAVVTIADDNDSAVLVSKASLSISEIGQTDSLDVWLNSAPAFDVTVQFSCDLDALKLSTVSLTFTSANWSIRQSVAVSAINNNRTQGLLPSVVTIAVTSADAAYNAPLRTSVATPTGFVLGRNIYTQIPGTYDTGNALHAFPWLENLGVMTSPAIAPAATVFVLDNDPAGIIVMPEDGRHSSASKISPENYVAVRMGGHVASLSITLASEPAGSVVVTLVPETNGGVQVTPASITFASSHWGNPQEVQLTAVSSTKAKIDESVSFTSVQVVVSSTGDSSYDHPGDPMATIYVQRYPSARVLFDASELETRENRDPDTALASYELRLGSEPMHWEPEGSRQYHPFELVLDANSDTTLTLSEDSVISIAAAGAQTTFSAAANASSSSTASHLTRIGVLRFMVSPIIAAATRSYQVGGAKLRLYRSAGGENGGLRGISVGVVAASGSIAQTWDEASLRAACAPDASFQIICTLSNAALTSLPLSSLFPTSASFLNIKSASAGSTAIDPSGSFDDTANAFMSAPGWIEIDVTVVLNSFLAQQHQLELAKQPFSQALTLLVYTATAPTFVYDGASDVTFASKESPNSSLHPQLIVLGSGRVNLVATASVTQSDPGSAKAAIDGDVTSNLGVASTFAMSSVAYKYPWWQANLGGARLIDEIVVTVKRKVSSASMAASQLPVSFWLMLADTPLSTNNNGPTGLSAALEKALYTKQFDLSTRSFSAPESDTIVLRWRVFGAQGGAYFDDDHFHTNYSATVEAQYLLLQVEGENNIALNEVQIYQAPLASARVLLGGYMPSPSVVNKGKNQIAFHLDQPGDQDAIDCDDFTAVCRNELVFTSGDWWEAKRVQVDVGDDDVTTGDREILLTHTLQSTDPSFQGASVCDGATSDPCAPTLFNDSSVKTLQVLDDDETAILFSSSELQVEEGSGVYPHAPIVRRERVIVPASVRCSNDPAKVISAAGFARQPASCGTSFSSSPNAAAWETCVSDPAATTLATGSAWMIAGFSEDDINVTMITLTVPQMRGVKYVRKISLWWSDTLTMNGSAMPTLLNISELWTLIKTFSIPMTSGGIQTLRVQDLALESIKLLLVSFEKSYDDNGHCLVAPSVVIRARVPVQFPLPLRGDLSNYDSVPPAESGRSRMHQFGKTTLLHVQLASEPVENVTVAVVADADNTALSVFDGSTLPSSSSAVELFGGAYESGESVTFKAPMALVFTPQNWNITQSLTFLAVDDNIFSGNRTFSLSHATTSTDATAAVIPVQSFQSGKITRGVSVLATDLTYAEAPYMVSESRDPKWPRYRKPQWISGRGTVHVTAIDDDLPGVTLSAGAVVLSESAAQAGNYSVTLDSAPTSDVVVTINYELDASLLTVSPLRLQFSPTNWKLPQFVYIMSVPNEVYDAGSPLTIGYDRLVAKKSQPLLKHRVTSTKDAVYNGIAVGTNEHDRATPYALQQGVVVIIQDDDTGCPREYTCLNGGACENVTYGGRVGFSSASVCRCPSTYGMKNCSAVCATVRDCGFSRVDLVVKCLPGDATAICGDTFSPSRLVSTLYRMLTTNELTTSSGRTFGKLSLGAMAEAMYIVNATAVACVDARSGTSTCVKVTLDFVQTTGSTSDPIVAKLQGYLESGSLQSQPLFVELLTATPQYPQSIGATVAVWVFLGFCLASVGGVAWLFSWRYVKLKKFHVQPEADDNDATPTLQSLDGGGGVILPGARSAHAHAQ